MKAEQNQRPFLSSRARDASPDHVKTVFDPLYLRRLSPFRIMFELLHHALHMKAHFTALLPEEQHYEYQQEHEMGFCTQFQHCEDNPFYPDIVQADQNEGWYSTDQSGWLGLAPNDEVRRLPCTA